MTLTSQFTAVPIYVNGVRTEVGEIFRCPYIVWLNYLTGVPTISMERFTPTDQLGNELSETIVPFELRTCSECRYRTDWCS